MKSIIWDILQDYLQKNTSEEDTTTRIEQLEANDEIKGLLLIVKELVRDLVWTSKSDIKIDDILLYLNHSSVDVYVQTSKRVSEVLWVVLPEYEKEFNILDEKWIEVKFLWEVNWNVLRVKKVSKNLQAILGYDPKDFYFWHTEYEEIIYDDDIERRNLEIQKYLWEKRDEFTQEYRVKRKDWTIVTVLDKRYIQYWQDWNLMYIYWYIYNIQDTKLLEKKVLELTSELEIDMKTWEKSHSKLLSDLEQYCFTGRPFECWNTCLWTNICKGCNFYILKVTNINRILSFCQTPDEEDKITKEIIWMIKQKLGSDVNFYVISEWKYWIIINDELTREQLNKSLDKPLVVNEQNFNLDFIFWWVRRVSQGYQSPLELYRQANLMMKHQVLSEKNGFYYSKQLEEEIKEYELKSQHIDSIITLWFEEEWFIPYYQWIRDNKTGTIQKYEVLGRIKTTKKIYSIQNYLDRLVDTNKLASVMMIIIEKALIRLSSEQSNIEFAFNFTQSELNEPFINWFVERLDYYKIDRTRITLEVVETSYSSDNLPEIVCHLKSLGFKIGIDDFGTWYSNFERLLQIEPNFLKIDWSLIQWISRNKRQLEIVKAFLELAKILKAEVVAEKIGTVEDQNVLEILWVKYTQGYLYSQPASTF